YRTRADQKQRVFNFGAAAPRPLGGPDSMVGAPRDELKAFRCLSNGGAHCAGAQPSGAGSGQNPRPESMQWHSLWLTRSWASEIADILLTSHGVMRARGWPDDM